MCDNCKANETLISIILQRQQWIEEILFELTNGKSNEYLTVSNSIKKSIEHNIDEHTIRLLCDRKEVIRNRLKGDINMDVDE